MPRPATSTACAVLGAALLLTSCGSAEEPPSPVVSSPADAAPAVPDSFTVVATGDILIHPPLTEQAQQDAEQAELGEEFDYRPLFEGVRPLVSKADLALCHLEVPLSPEGGPYSGYPQFSAPPELAAGLADVGYDGCSTASNHTLDQGPDGVTSTLDALDAAGLDHTGAARSEQEAATPTVYDVGGVKVGQVSFTFGFNGFELPADQPWLSNQLDPDAVVEAAEAAGEAGAEVVIASLHWGAEYQHDPTEEQQQLAERLLGEDSIDLIIGHHAHVVQPFERIGDEWVAYGLGNSVARHEEPKGVSEEGVAARFRFSKQGERWTVDQAEYVPTLVELGPPIRLTDLTTAAATPRRTEALERTDDVVLSRGGAEDGLVRSGS
ncbi:poly-gamma-glutamate biosynthesis protein [Prauserella marina]|uniref:Poly-gamma-glutamate synthesis protein (Capsule biosynthesis protein) n=1 Tax=Prauserella marina TaxID=530584 RepID=A0A222VNA3_9PSEU|nr:CapA family protein [Prauserella marina]ASR35322.1 poly-gamma-glutamate biosynthesis protein [Prauserella marina]PWV84890.1 poly-gamma-glutamate synthesis protein (capsule biosynthesis protein) [Prauserella marina]SDC10308.1 poly-gamma-glutamate synthesis protein (capsule biosynthesis protein) [Prauserella marina]